MTLPRVSIIVPCYNEEKRIRFLLDAIFTQTYPAHLLDVTIANGPSTDRTTEIIAQFQREHPQLRLQVISNNTGTIPAGLNQAIRSSDGEIIVRLDAHSGPYPDYVEKCVAALQAEKGANVGGVWEIRPNGEDWIAQSIAFAAAHPLGVGDALYRHATQPAEVDTVPFGAFRRSLLEKIGLFDETLLTNEDYEFNTRIRQSGGKVWLDPAIRSVYFARPTLAALAKQYWRYGFWKWKMLQRYPGTLRWRQALPPLFVLSLIALTALGLAWPLFWLLLALQVLTYLLIFTVAGLQLALKHRNPPLVIGLPLAIPVMHLAWGSGFLWSILKRA